MRDFRLLQRCKWDLCPSGMLRSVDWQLGTDISEQPTMAIILVIRVRQWELDYQAGKSRVSKRVTVDVRKCKLYWNFYIHNPQNIAKKIFSMHLKGITLWNSAQGEITDIIKTKQIKFLPLFYNRKGCDSSVGMATWRELNGPEVKSPKRTIFSAFVQTGLGTHPAPFTVGTASLYREWRDRGVHHSPHLTPRLKKE
jgi:hypothetical protein